MDPPRDARLEESLKQVLHDPDQSEHARAIRVWHALGHDVSRDFEALRSDVFGMSDAWDQYDGPDPDQDDGGREFFEEDRHGKFFDLF